MKTAVKLAAAFLFAAILLNTYLAADDRPIVPADKTVRVIYQVSRDGKSWTSGGTSMTGAVTEDMMANTVASSHPNAQVRILSASCGKDVRVSVRYQVSRDGKSWTSGSTT